MARSSTGRERDGAPARGSSHPLSAIGLTGRVAAFIGASILAGALVAGIALPFAGALGLSAKAASENFDELPADLEQPAFTQPSYIYDSTGGLLAMVYARYRIIIGEQDMAPVMRSAIVAIEDDRFFQHGPIDLKGTLRALLRNQNSEGGVKQGGSSLTQQYVKNVFIEQAGDDPLKVQEATRQEISRKIKELKYAIGLEQKLSKDQILTNYLNITFFGQQAYGVEAASLRYFSKHAKDLTLAEAATLAGIVQAPSQYDPINAPEAALTRRNVVLQRMLEVGAASAPEVEAAKALPLGLKVQPLTNGCITADQHNGAAFFCDYVERTIKTDPAFGKTKEERAALWRTGGLQIVTTLDPKMQEAARKGLLTKVGENEVFAAATSLVEPGTGRIKAMAQTRPYGFSGYETVINLNVDHNMGGSVYGFQPGSTMKPFTAAAALENGFKPDHTITTGSSVKIAGETYKTCAAPWVGTPSEKPIQNETESEAGSFNMVTAMQMSVNSYFVELSHQMGLCPLASLAAEIGLHRGNGDPLGQYPGMTLGQDTVSPLNLANAYAMLANRGTYCTPVAILEVKRLDGTKLPVPQTQCKRVIKESTADTVTALLENVVNKGTGVAAKLSDRDSAGKTGTVDFKKAAWFAGYTPNLAAAVWTGSPTTPKEMINVRIGGQYYASVKGAELPAPIWKSVMSGALKGVPARSFAAAPALPAGPSQNPRGEERRRDTNTRDNRGNQNRPGGPTISKPGTATSQGGQTPGGATGTAPGGTTTGTAPTGTSTGGSPGRGGRG